MAKAKLAQNLFDRHRDKIATAGPGDCWLWTAGKFSTGYGAVWAKGQNRLAHRAAYEAVHGPGSAAGLVVRHKCDVKACVNPAHLELGTRDDNMRDMVERGRHVACMGKANGNAKLTDADVRTIRAKYVSGGPECGLSALGRLYGTSPSNIRRIVDRTRWRHVA